MKGDIIIVEEYHKRAAQKIVQKIINEINTKSTRYIITVAGESGSGKSETGKALQDELESHQIKAILLGQDDYFVLPPRANDAKRREDEGWLGPHVEVRMDVLEQNIMDAITGKNTITKPLIDYENNSISEEKVDLSGVKVLIVEGTYTSLLKNVDQRVFINRNFGETLAHRRKRKRGKEVDDPFIEKILATEHKIIAGHKYLADIVIANDYEVIFPEKVI